jgi:hypothetical protein
VGMAEDCVADVKVRIAAAGFDPECKKTLAWWVNLPDEDRRWFLKRERKLKREQRSSLTFTDAGIEQI